uniref:CCHC-type domain-containing protein n=1 Tax=Cyprinus carpio TaxID=7962 RepID=A0A8C1MIW4_CYPCA
MGALSQTRQAPTPSNHSALPHLSTDHTHLPLVSTIIHQHLKDTHTHTVTVWSRSQLGIPICRLQGLPFLYLPVSSDSQLPPVSFVSVCVSSALNVSTLLLLPGPSPYIISRTVFSLLTLCNHRITTVSHPISAYVNKYHLTCDLLSPTHLYCNRRPDLLLTDTSMSHPDPFQDLVDALRRTLNVPPAPSPPASTSGNDPNTSSPSVPSSPMAKPAPFSGSAEECSGFLLQCSLVLEMQPHLYPTELSKVAFIISQLKGKALQWADSIWTQKNPVTQSYTSFVDHFREVFGKPTWDSSIGEKLYNLKQGKMSVNDYALQFRTLAATSGWNEQALLTTYRQGLDPQVRLHLAAYEDTIGLERFIQLSIRFATRMKSCLEEHQGQPQHNISLCRPEPVNPPEPAHEPMLLDSNHLTRTEWQRRLTQNLCLYCGSPGHILSTCPIRPPRSLVSAIFPTIKQMKPLTPIVTLTAADISVSVNALLDSGSAGNFISGSLCRQLHLPTTATQSSYQIHSITGRPLSRKWVRRSVGPLQLQIGILHKERIHLLVLEESTADVVLGRPWLEQHNPVLSWKTGEILKWGETCFMDCFPEVPVPSSQLPKPLSVCATSIESPMERRSVDIPSCYAPFSDVFCPKRASKLPPHRPWDCA